MRRRREASGTPRLALEFHYIRVVILVMGAHLDQKRSLLAASGPSAVDRWDTWLLTGREDWAPQVPSAWGRSRSQARQWRGRADGRERSRIGEDGSNGEA